MTTWNEHKYGDDATSDTGAHELAQRIRRYWRRRGYSVDVRLVRAAFEASLRQGPLVIRSDMINGLPRACVKARQAEGRAA